MQKYSKKILTKLSILITTLVIAGVTTDVYAALDPRVKASNSEVVYNQSSNSSKATGYITANQRHYCSVKLFRVGNEIAYSGRKYGTGKVSNSTGYVKCGAAGATMDGHAVYYGF